MNLALRYFTTYQAGPIDAGVFLAWQQWHAGAEARNATITQTNDLGMRLVLIKVQKDSQDSIPTI